MSLVATTEGGSYGLYICLVLFIGVGKTCVGHIEDDLRQRGMMEVGPPIVYLGARNVLLRNTFVVSTLYFDSPIRSVPKVKLIPLR